MGQPNVTSPAARLLLLLALTAAAGSALSGCGGAGATKSTTSAAVVDPASRFVGSEQMLQTPPDFVLRDQDGRLVRLSAERGKFVLVTFLYTQCPDVCPLIAANLNGALRKLGKARASVRVLAVSVDPRGDTRSAVRRYVKTHRLLPEFRYLTGSRDRLKGVWRAYHVAVVARKPEFVDHVAYVLLIDRTGKTRLLYDSLVTTRDILHDLRLLQGTER